ncbi:type II secretion system protein N [Leptolyngbya sp. AN03gr2]|uniref:type II secretion system protein N n=1 Tax=unclassified Leptolyngbya TaxID=2650499 RepID=UPI003D31B38C
MPQTINGATNYLEPSRATSAQPSTKPYGLMPAPVQVDTYADRLMDDLFEDVEDLLSGSVPPPEPIRVKPQPSIDLPLQTAAPLVFKPVAQPQLPQWSSPAPEAAIASKPVKQKSYGFQKFLAIVFGLSALSAASVWLIQRGTVQRFFALAAKEPTVVATAPKVAPADTTAQFAQYMKRSLENIDRKASNSKSTTVAFNRNLPSIPIAGNPRSTNSSERTPVVINVPSVPAPNPVVTAVSKNPQELNQVLTRLSSVLERLSINPASSRSQPVSAPIAIQPAQAVSSEPQRTLRGIAIANDPTQSAILFEMNGVTQRYYIGESIGSSGWSVVDISNNYVSVRRNGEVRTISIGQKL